VKLIRGGSAPAPGSPALVCDTQAVTNDCEVVDKVLFRGSKFVSLARPTTTMSTRSSSTTRA